MKIKTDKLDKALVPIAKWFNSLSKDEQQKYKKLLMLKEVKKGDRK